MEVLISTHGLARCVYDMYASHGWDMSRYAAEYTTQFGPTSVLCIGRFGQTISQPYADAVKAGFEIIRGDGTPEGWATVTGGN